MTSTPAARPDLAPRPPGPADPRAGLWQLWLPVAALLLGVALLLLLGHVIDLSALEQSPDSFGYLGGAVIVSFFYGLPALALLLVLAIVGSLSGSERARVALAGLGAGLLAASGGWFVLFSLVTIHEELPAGQVFFAVGSVLALVLVLPLVRFVVARRQSLRRRT